MLMLGAGPGPSRPNPGLGGLVGGVISNSSDTTPSDQLCGGVSDESRVLCLPTRSYRVLIAASQGQLQDSFLLPAAGIVDFPNDVHGFLNNSSVPMSPQTG